MRILHDDYGNRAEVEEVVTLPYRNAPSKQKCYRLSLYAEYDNDFLYFVSMYGTEREVADELKCFSCGTWK